MTAIQFLRTSAIAGTEITYAIPGIWITFGFARPGNAFDCGRFRRGLSILKETQSGKFEKSVFVIILYVFLRKMPSDQTNLQNLEIKKLISVWTCGRFA